MMEIKILGEAEKIRPNESKAIMRVSDPDPTPPMRSYPGTSRGYKPSKLDLKLDLEAYYIKSRLDFDRGMDKVIQNYPVHMDGKMLSYADCRTYYYQLSAQNEDRRRSMQQPLKTGGWDEFD